MNELVDDVLGAVCALLPFGDLDSLALAHPTRFRSCVRAEQTRRAGPNVSVPQYRSALQSVEAIKFDSDVFKRWVELLRHSQSIASIYIYIYIYIA